MGATRTDSAGPPASDSVGGAVSHSVLGMLSALVARPRRAVISILERAGQVDRAREAYGRWSPSRTVRRDHRDMVALRSVIAATAGGGGGIGVDVGANTGTVSAMLFDVSPTEQHVLIEPVGELAARLEARFPGAEVHCAVCGDHETVVPFVVAVDRPTRSSIHGELARSGGRTETRHLRQVVLDALLTGKRVAVVKIDVEGAELDVVRGLRRTLLESRPVVIFEHFGQDVGGPDGSASLFDEFERAGYRVFDIDGSGPMNVVDFEETVRRGRVWTFIAVPQRGTD